MSGAEEVVPIHPSIFLIPSPKLPSPKVSYLTSLKEYAAKDIAQSDVKAFVRSLDETYSHFTASLESTVTSEESFFAAMTEYLGVLMALVDSSGSIASLPSAVTGVNAPNEVDAALAKADGEKKKDDAAALDAAILPSPPLSSAASAPLTGDSPLRFAIDFSWNQVVLPATAPVRMSDAVYELISTLVAGAVWAVRRANTLCESTPAGVPSAPAAQSYRLLRQAAGMLNHAASNVIPLLKSGSNPSSAPDVSPEVLRALASCALADAQGISVIRAVKKGNQPALIASLAVATGDMYRSAAVGLSAVPGAAVSKLAAYLEYKKACYDSYAHIFNGISVWKGGQAGAGLRCIKEAETSYFAAKKAAAVYDKAAPSTLGQLHRRFDEELDRVLYDTQRRITNENSAVYFQPVPAAPAPLPAGKQLATADAYVLPAVAKVAQDAPVATAFERLPSSAQSKASEGKNNNNKKKDEGGGGGGGCGCCGCFGSCIGGCLGGCLCTLIQRMLCCFGAGPPAAQALSACQQQFVGALNTIGKNASYDYYKFIDPDTPEANCKIQLCQGDYTKCDPLQDDPVVKDDLILVFSDEFEQENRKFDVKSQDIRWTAEDMYYFPTQDVEVYKPEQVITWKGKAVVTIDKSPRPVSAPSLQPDGTKWNVAKNFKSGMVNGWNKWCFTGGYMEMSVKLPGSAKVPGFWPAFWAMGNLGRAGYMPSTGGFWPYSYDTCGEGSSMDNAIPGSQVPSQLVSACPDNRTSPDYVNRTLYGFQPGQARNAPEFDVFEIVVNRNTGSEASQTLQMAPLIPAGTTWANLQWYRDNNILPEGVQYPGGISFLRTEGNQWSGTYGRPGNAYQDSMSAVSHLNDTFYEGYHTFGVDWAPGEYLRWYVDGIFAYEINPNALLAQTGVMDGKNITIGKRMIPLEPMYMIFNLGMSPDFGEVDVDNLPFPAWMMIDYIRVYQRANKINVGCNPPGYETEQWIACHKDNYIVNSDDNILIKKSCKSGAVAGAVPSVMLGLVVALLAVLFV